MQTQRCVQAAGGSAGECSCGAHIQTTWKKDLRLRGPRKKKGVSSLQTCRAAAAPTSMRLAVRGCSSATPVVLQGWLDTGAGLNWLSTRRGDLPAGLALRLGPRGSQSRGRASSLRTRGHSSASVYGEASPNLTARLVSRHPVAKYLRPSGHETGRAATVHTCDAKQLPGQHCVDERAQQRLSPAARWWLTWSLQQLQLSLFWS